MNSYFKSRRIFFQLFPTEFKYFIHAVQAIVITYLSQNLFRKGQKKLILDEIDSNNQHLIFNKCQMYSNKNLS